MKKVTCTICETQTQGQYCHTCGQKNTGKRLNLRSVIEDFVSNIFSLEKSGFATILQLITKPVTVIESYWNGFRGHYQPPSKLFVYATIAFGIHLYLNENRIFGFQYTEDPKVVFFLMFLTLLTFSSYLVYFKRRHTLLEHIVATIYLFCTWSIVLILFYEAITLIFGEELIISAVFTISLLLLILISNARVFSKNYSLLKTSLTVVLQLSIMILILAFIIFLNVTLSDLEISTG